MALPVGSVTVPVVARAAVAVGVAGVFMETHPNPDEVDEENETLGR